MTRYPEVPDLPDDLYGELVDNLFGTFGAWLAAVIGSLTMASAGAYIDGRPCFEFCLTALGLLSLVRADLFCLPTNVRPRDVARTTSSRCGDGSVSTRCLRSPGWR